MELGVTLFDTADRYMKGRHERMLGRALKGRRDKAVVCSKFGNIDNPDGTKAYNGRPEHVRSACEASLAQLGVDTIDLYYLHRFRPGNFEKNLELVKTIEAIAAKRGATSAQVALAWLLSRGADVFPIPGTKQEKWLEQNAAAVDLALDPGEIETLSATFKPGARAGERYDPGYFVTLGA